MSRKTRAAWALAAICALSAGPQAWAKALWRAGFPALAVPLLPDGAARGAALYAAGRYAAADAAFAAVGRSATYDRGLSLAATGRYSLSVAYFDAVLFADQYDSDARHNRDIVAGLVPPVIGAAMGHGRIRAILKDSGFDATAFDPDAPDAPIRAVDWVTDRDSLKRSVNHDRSVGADAAWLDTLSDAPGAYLKARLQAEMDRRHEAGEAARAEPSPW